MRCVVMNDGVAAEFRRARPCAEQQRDDQVFIVTAAEDALIAEEVGRPVDYLPVPAGGAERVAARLADLV